MIIQTFSMPGEPLEFQNSEPVYCAHCRLEWDESEEDEKWHEVNGRRYCMNDCALDDLGMQCLCCYELYISDDHTRQGICEDCMRRCEMCGKHICSDFFGIMTDDSFNAVQQLPVCQVCSEVCQ